MRQSYILILIFLGFAFMTMGFQCRKDYPALMPSYEYTEKLSLMPYKKSYSINDTIWMQFQTLDKTLFDKLSNRRISTDTTFLRVNLNFCRRYPIRNVVELFSDAKVENVSDVTFTPLYTRYNVLNFKTNCGVGPYFFKVGFVPKQTGVYSIEPSGDVSACPTKLTLAYSTFKLTFDLPDCNKDVWLSIPPQSRGGELGYTDVSIDKKEIFVFKVE